MPETPTARIFDDNPLSFWQPSPIVIIARSKDRDTDALGGCLSSLERTGFDAAFAVIPNPRQWMSRTDSLVSG